jgi:hypothetical protein
MLERLQGEAPDLTSPERQSEGPASSGAYRSILCFLGPWSMPRPVNRNFVLEAQLKECKTSGALIPPATPSAKRRMIRLEARSSPPGFFFWNIERIRKLAGQPVRNVFPLSPGVPSIKAEQVLGRLPSAAHRPTTFFSRDVIFFSLCGKSGLTAGNGRALRCPCFGCCACLCGSTSTSLMRTFQASPPSTCSALDSPTLSSVNVGPEQNGLERRHVRS